MNSSFVSFFSGVAYIRRRGIGIGPRDSGPRAGEPSEPRETNYRAESPVRCSESQAAYFILSAEQISADDAVLLVAAARAVVGRWTWVAGRSARSSFRRDALRAAQLSARSTATEPAAQPAKPPEGLSFWNGIGGFTRDGREYVMVIDGAGARRTGLAAGALVQCAGQPGFGCLVTEAGLGYSWAGNSQMNRLTPWSNDPTSDSPGEVIYLRDEETGEVWTPTPLPRGPRAAVTVRHGQGYTRYTHISRNLNQDVLVLVPRDDPVKLVYLTVRNNASGRDSLSATFYGEWVLGSVRENAPLQVVASAIRKPVLSSRATPGLVPSPRRLHS